MIKIKSKMGVTMLLVLGLCGCGTTPEQRVRTAADVAQFCAYNASEVLLIEKPQAEPGLRLTANNLRKLEAMDTIKMTDILLIIGTLPPDQLRSPYGRLLIQNGTLLLIRLGNRSDLAQTDLKPIVVGLREGIEMRIGPPAS